VNTSITAVKRTIIAVGIGLTAGLVLESWAFFVPHQWAPEWIVWVTVCPGPYLGLGCLAVFRGGEALAFPFIVAGFIAQWGLLGAIVGFSPRVYHLLKRDT
jgi:hypothetical protein